MNELFIGLGAFIIGFISAWVILLFVVTHPRVTFKDIWDGLAWNFKTRWKNWREGRGFW